MSSLIRHAAAVPVSPVRPRRLRGRVFRGTEVVRHGLLSEDQLRSSAWQRLRRDVCADADLPRDHLLHIRGVSAVAPPEAAFDGVVLLDRLVQAGIADLAQVRAGVTALPRCRGSRLAREIAALADGLAGSRPETRLRLLLRRAGLPTPVAQYRRRLTRLTVAGWRVIFVTAADLRDPDALVRRLLAALAA